MLLSEILTKEKNDSLPVDVLLLYEELELHNKTISDLEKSEALLILNTLMEPNIDNLRCASLTSELWAEYLATLALARKLAQADRLGSWSLHLEAIRDCLPLFAAAGHFNYLKSAFLYLQTMKQLPEKNPHLYAKFQKGFHVVHSSDTPWSGLGCDLVID